MKITINGIGCNLSGGKLVLEQFISSIPTSYTATAFVPNSYNVKEDNDSVKIKIISHKIFGKYFRPLYDVFISLYAKIFTSGLVLNLSNYGIPIFNREILYIHNPLLVDQAYYKKNTSFSVLYKKFAFLLSLKKAEIIIVQTDHMYKTLLSLMSMNNIPILDRVIVLKPLHEIINIVNDNKTEESRFRLFYPASTFNHKRSDLAIDSVVAMGDSYLLDITVDEEVFKDDKNINLLGKIDYSDVIKYFNKCDALLFTSEKETLGLPLLEALSLSKPAILPNLPYAKEIYGDAAVYFDRFEVEEVSKAISELINNFNSYKSKAEKRKEIEFSGRYSWKNQWEVVSKKIQKEHG